MNEKISSANQYAPSWESLQDYRVPEWYLDAKFGIFIHWGLYSVPAFSNEWYPRNMYLTGTPEYEHHRLTYRPQSHFGYKNFIPLFTAEKFSPDRWAQLFKESGARYVVPVAEHHDGFAMYDCSTSRWTATKMGPKRDILGELAATVRERGMVFGLSSHRAEHWWFMNGGRTFASDIQDPLYQDFYGPAVPMEGDPGTLVSRPYPDGTYLEDWLRRTCELVDKYRPQLVWFDWWIGHAAFKPYLPRLVAYYYNRALEWNLGVAVNYKLQAMPAEAAVLDVERGQLKDIRPSFWQTDTSISKNSWGYITKQDYKTAGSIIGDLVDIVSKNGCLLLNIGPRPDGAIPEIEQEILLEIGHWLAVNGEAVYATRPWKVFGEGPTQVIEGSFKDTERQAFTGQDFRFTQKGEALYAICLAWPGEEALVKSLGSGSGLLPGRIRQVSMLGFPGPLSWSQEAEGLRVTTPAAKPCRHAFTFKILCG